MTVNEFVRRIQAKVSMLSTGDILIKLNGKDIECVIELIENGKGYYINIKQPTKDLALTREDVQTIDNIIVDMAQHTDWPLKGKEVFYEEVLCRFIEKREKK